MCKFLSFINSVLVYFIGAVLLLSLYQGFAIGVSPCPLCLLQRFFLTGVAIPLLFNIKGGRQLKNYTASLFACMLGAVVAFYQWAQLIENNGVSHAPQIFSQPLYIWSAIVFMALAIIIIIMMLFMNPLENFKADLFGKVSYIFFAMILVAEMVLAFSTCGIMMC
jgi:disulfide bond formation protein DsbB